MSPILYVIIAQTALLGLACVGYVELLDRAEARRRAKRPSPTVIGSDVQVPKAIAVPAIARRRSWPWR